MFTSMFQLMGLMFLIILAGAILRKKGIITIEGKKCLTDLILYLILPCNIVRAFCLQGNNGFWSALPKVLVVSLLIQVVSVILNRILYYRITKSEQQVYQYATVCSNAGFMGNPLAEGVFGDTGLLYASIFLIPLRITMWTAGISYFTQEANKLKLIGKVLIHPCMIAVYIGMFLMITRISLPVVIMDATNSFSACCTPLTMLYIGTILVDVNIKTIVSVRQIYFALIRLLLLPLLVLAGCRIAQVDPLVMGVCVLMTAMPAGSTTSLLAAKYGADELSAAKCVVFTTAISIITTPVWSYILLKML